MVQGRRDYTPGIDASLGLIFRLNILWQTADRKALAGDMEGWNFTLDRIYCNLSYRGEMFISYEDKEETKIKDIEISQDNELKILNKFKEMLKSIKSKRLNAIKKKERVNYNIANEEYYIILTKKDIWLRKLMQTRGLYLKEIEFNAARAILGG